MKIQIPDGPLIDTSAHDCSRFGASPCVFCKMNEDIKADPEMNGRYYAVPFDVPGVYDPKGEPTVKIVRL